MTLKTSIKVASAIDLIVRKPQSLDMSTKCLLVVLLFSLSHGSWLDVMDSLVPIPVPRCTDVGISLTPSQWEM